MYNKFNTNSQYTNTSECPVCGGYETSLWREVFDDRYGIQICLNCYVVMTVLPSIQENLSNTVIESMACGTPVVAFNIGGMPDMIKYEYNGFLAEPFEMDSLKNGIKWVLNYSDKISDNAREHAVTNYQLETVSGKYFSLYQDILK